MFDKALPARCFPIAKLMFENLQQVFLMGVSFHLVTHGSDVLAKPQALAAFGYLRLASSATPPQELVVTVIQVRIQWRVSQEHRPEAPRIQTYDVAI